MTEGHESALAALDGFWNVIRDKADADPAFARALVNALGVPIQIQVQTPIEPEDFKRIVNFIEPRLLTKRGEVKFREIFTALSDAQKKTVILNYNLASKDALTGKRGLDLVNMLWDAASAQAAQMDR